VLKDERYTSYLLTTRHSSVKTYPESQFAAREAKGHSISVTIGASFDDEISNLIGYGYTLRMIVSIQRPRSCNDWIRISYEVMERHC